MSHWGDIPTSNSYLGSPCSAERAAAAGAEAASALEAAQAGVPDSPWQAGASLAEPAVQGT